MNDVPSPDSIETLSRDPRWDADDEDWPSLAEKTLSAVNVALKPERRGEIALLLDDDAALQALNAQWRGKDKPTNVLSFPAPPGPMLGDIAVSRDTLAREAAEQGKTFRDHALHMIVHGLLHLHGFDHETDDEAGAMEALETQILATLGVDDPYASEAAHAL